MLKAKAEQTSLALDVAIGRNLKAKRLNKGVTLKDLAKLLEISVNQLNKYEAGINRISCSKMYIISKKLDYDIAEMFENLEGTADISTKEKPDVELIGPNFQCASFDSKTNQKITSLALESRGHLLLDNFCYGANFAIATDAHQIFHYLRLNELDKGSRARHGNLLEALSNTI